MNKENAIRLFQDQKVRVSWDDKAEKWYFSIVDVVSILTNNDFQGARNYWKVLKHRLIEEGNQTVTDCNQLKLPAEDGKMRFTDVADTEQLLRLVQSIPSKKAEPFKLWLAKVGNERIDETHDPELTIDRAMRTYLQKGFSKEWINQRLKTIEIRKELTDEWERVGVKDASEFAILTNEMTRAWAGLDIKDYKALKGVKKENLRDNMTNMEVVLNMLAEVTTKEISASENPRLFQESEAIAKRGGGVAGNARKDVEKQIGRPVLPNKKQIQ
jgi:hypothetical protein